MKPFIEFLCYPHKLPSIISAINLASISLQSTGGVMYFYYGIKHSSLEESNDDLNAEPGCSNAGNIELTVTDPSKSTLHHHHKQAQPSSSSAYATDRSIYEGQQLDAFGQPVFGSTNFGGTPAQGSSTGDTPQSSSFFVSQDNFPTWDD